MIKTRKDSGIIDRPTLAPHLELFTFSKKGAGITDEVIAANPSIVDTNYFTFVVDKSGSGHYLKGIVKRDILRLVNGKNSRDDIVATLQENKNYNPSDINAHLANLAYNGIIVSADHSLDTDQAIFWSDVGITPKFFDDFSAAVNISIESLNDNEAQLRALTKAFMENKVNIRPKSVDADLVIVLVDDYMHPALDAYNKSRVADKQRWIPVKLSGTLMHYGPVFSPAKNSTCLHCITNNMRNNREMRGFLSHHMDNAMVSKKHSNQAGLLAAHSNMVALNILKYLILEDVVVDKKIVKVTTNASVKENYAFTQKLNDYLVSFHPLSLEITTHFANKRPQCLSCGDADLTDPSRQPTVPDLSLDDLKSVFTSGGMKAVSPQETINKYQHLVSPITGIISGIEKSSPPDDEWMHVYWSGSNLAIVNRSFMALSNSIRSKSAGKGRTDAQAKASAMCEALERYSGVFNGDEIRKIACFNDFASGDALHPNDLMQFSDKQYRMRTEIAAKQYRFYRLPEEDFDPNALVEWSPVWNISQQKHIWMMTYQLYFSYDPFYSSEGGIKLNRNFANPDSNGAAAGNTLAEAFVQGFMELIERDAYAIWWYNQVQYPEVDIASFNDPYLDTAVKRYQDVYNRKLWVLDITNDFGIPVFVALSARTDKQKQDICISAGAHFDPHIALLRAVCELNQYISAVLRSTDEEDSYTYFDRECNDWWQNATLESEPYLLPDAQAKIIRKDDYPLIDRNPSEEMQACIDAVHAKGLEVMVLDQTRADIKIPVIKVIVPGMRHFWARFAPGRLYDVPVAMGKLKEPKREEDLNPTPVFI